MKPNSYLGFVGFRDHSTQPTLISVIDWAAVKAIAGEKKGCKQVRVDP
ncbi:MAG: hypothetical protein F6K14_01560 [Symploca sp. SIO2C1]|nr:hypothetical protein [Symploca sp. SIO2C1]